MVGSREPGGPGVVRTTALYVGAFLLAPNLLFWIAGLAVYLVRPPVNVDYAVLGATYPLWGAGVTAVVASVLVLMDLLQSALPGYNLSARTLVESLSDVVAFPWPVTLLVALLVLGAAALLARGASKAFGRLPRQLLPGAVVLALGATLAIGQKLLQRPWGPEGRSPLGTQVATSPAVFLVNAVRTAHPTEARGPEAYDVPAATDTLFDVLGSEGTLPPRVVLVVVESLGLFEDEALNRLQLSRVTGPSVEARYRLRRGTVPYRGSTVPAELRELCRIEVRTVHPDPALLPLETCLPRRLQARGFHTVAVHGFAPSFFRRGDWYPALGFDEILFAPELDHAGLTDRCGLAFVGSCDHDVNTWIRARLRQADEDRLFLYWLTLSAHTPASAPDPEHTDLECVDVGVDVGPEVCRILRHHDVTLGGLARIATAPELPPTAFILVGDHVPHVLGREGRQRFVAGRVPYVILWPREESDIHE